MYKDNDFVSEGIKICIGATMKQRVMTILKTDTDVNSYFPARSKLYFIKSKELLCLFKVDYLYCYISTCTILNVSPY